MFSLLTTNQVERPLLPMFSISLHLSPYVRIDIQSTLRIFCSKFTRIFFRTWQQHYLLLISSFADFPFDFSTPVLCRYRTTTTRFTRW